MANYTITFHNTRLFRRTAKFRNSSCLAMVLQWFYTITSTTLNLKKISKFRITCTSCCIDGNYYCTKYDRKSRYDKYD